MSAIDELGMATERLRVRLPDEPKPKLLHIIEPHEVSCRRSIDYVFVFKLYFEQASFLYNPILSQVCLKGKLSLSCKIIQNGGLDLLISTPKLVLISMFVLHRPIKCFLIKKLNLNPEEGHTVKLWD